MAESVNTCKGCPPGEVRPAERPLRLLLADPDLRRREVLARRLKGLGHAVLLELADGVMALEMSRHLKPDAIVAVAAPASGAAELADAAGAEGIAPVVIVLDISCADAGEVDGAWGIIPSCASARVLGSVTATAVRRFRERKALEKEKLSVEQRLRSRQVVEQAKGLIMQARQCSEAEAYRHLQRRSMDTGKSLLQVAEAVLLAGGSFSG